MCGGNFQPTHPWAVPPSAPNSPLGRTSLCPQLTPGPYLPLPPTHLPAVTPSAPNSPLGRTTLCCLLLGASSSTEPGGGSIAFHFDGTTVVCGGLRWHLQYRTQSPHGDAIIHISQKAVTGLQQVDAGICRDGEFGSGVEDGAGTGAGVGISAGSYLMKSSSRITVVVESQQGQRFQTALSSLRISGLLGRPAAQR